LLYFCLFCVVFICFVGFCPNVMRKKRKFLTPLTIITSTARACSGTVVPSQPNQNPKNGSKTGTAVRNHQLSITSKKKKFLPHSITTTLSSLKLLSKTSITKNLQTSIIPQKLHQIKRFLTQTISKHHSKHKPTIKTNIHPPKPQIHQIHNPFNPNPKTIIYSPISIIKLKNLT